MVPYGLTSHTLWEFAEEKTKWTGTTKELFEKLEPRASGHEGWVRSPRGLGAVIARMGPALREVGVQVESERSRDGYIRTVTYLSQDIKVLNQRSQRSHMHLIRQKHEDNVSGDLLEFMESQA